jgi:Zn-dependent M28 family amino/carboxypeptidase
LPAKLRAAADYIEQVWSNQGYRVSRQRYTAGGVECCNLEVQINGMSEPGPVILVGAHYDSVPGSPGANDNASGVASLLELSRVSATLSSEYAIRFVAFVNEEPPYFETALQGSAVYARAARQRGDDIRAMIALETMGCFSDAPDSQQFPVPLFKLIYPTRGNYIAFVSNFGSRGVMHDAVRAFRAHTDFPVECCATYAKIAGVGWSDHAPFWREGYRAFMITDTAPFRYPHYHTEDDTPDKVNYDALARVTQGLAGVLAKLRKTN